MQTAVQKGESKQSTAGPFLGKAKKMTMKKTREDTVSPLPKLSKYFRLNTTPIRFLIELISSFKIYKKIQRT